MRLPHSVFIVRSYQGLGGKILFLTHKRRGDVISRRSDMAILPGVVYSRRARGRPVGHYAPYFTALGGIARFP